jgi:hypothetical protein
MIHPAAAVLAAVAARRSLVGALAPSRSQVITVLGVLLAPSPGRSVHGARGGFFASGRSAGPYL